MPQFMIAAREIPEAHIDPEVFAQTGRQFEILTTDLTPVHLCEITPSYCFDVLRIETERRCDDDLHLELQQWLHEQDVAIHCKPAMALQHTVEECDSYAEFVESHNCNHTFTARF